MNHPLRNAICPSLRCQIVLLMGVLIICFLVTPAKSQEVEVEVKTPRLISFTSSWYYFYGEYSPQKSFLNQDIKQNKGEIMSLGFGFFTVPKQKTTSTTADLRLEYRRTHGEWDVLLSEASLNSYTILIGPRFFSDRGKIKYTLAALAGVEWAHSSNDDKFLVELQLSAGLGISLGQNSRLMIEGVYHPISKEIETFEVRSFGAICFRWMIFLPEHEKWTTYY
ncbi:MAG: hypothetical protein PHU81_06400 [Acidobacteriota bacterium]|nr:hypothetical protein [Acidobacteriota bacterium]